MLTLNDIINVSFRKSNFSGYRSEDVDDFIDEVKDSYDLLIKKNIEQKETNDALTAEIARLKKENEELKVYVDQYQKDEDEIKNALISAQKLSDASIREARHKAEIILKDANLKAERIVSSAEVEIMEQKGELDRIKQLVSDFRSNLLDMYKEHLRKRQRKFCIIQFHRRRLGLLSRVPEILWLIHRPKISRLPFRSIV